MWTAAIRRTHFTALCHGHASHLLTAPSSAPTASTGLRLCGRPCHSPTLHCSYANIPTGIFHRYCAVNERTIILGKPTALQEKMHSVVIGALDAMMALAKPGVTLGQLYACSVAFFDDAGFGEQKYYACGYGLGATYR